jgi:hypothetical protein
LANKRKLSNKTDQGHCHSQVKGTFFPSAVARQRFYLLPIASIEQDSLILPIALTLHRAMLRSIRPLSIGLRNPAEHVRGEKRREKSLVRDGLG